MFAVGQNDAADRDLIERADGFPDHGVGIMAGLAIGNDVVGTNQI